MNVAPKQKRMLRAREAAAYIGIAFSTLYVHTKDGVVPEGVNIGGRAVAWPIDELDMIVNARIAGFSNDQVRELVKQITAERPKRAPKITLCPPQPNPVSSGNWTSY